MLGEPYSTLEVTNVNNFFLKAEPVNIYHIVIPMTNKLGRIDIVSRAIPNINGCLLYDQLIESGDSVCIDVFLQDSSRFTVNYSGHGAYKYDFLKENHWPESVVSFRNSPDWKSVLNTSDPIRKIGIVDSMILNCIKILEYKYSSIQPEIREVLKLDISAIGYKNLLYDIQHPVESGIDTLRFIHALKMLLARDDKANSVDLRYSPHYIRFLYEKRKVQLLFSKNGDNIFSLDPYNSSHVSFREVYEDIKRHYLGKNREYLLAYCINNSRDIALFFKGVNPEDFTLVSL